MPSSLSRAMALCALLVALSPAWSAETDELPVVSLEELLRRAERDNPVVDIARAELASYQARFDRAYYSWTPTLKVDALLAPLPERRLLRRCVLGTDIATGLDSVGPCPGQNIQDDEQITADTEIGILVRASLKVTFPIYTFGKVESGLRAARAGLEVGEAGVDIARAGLAFEVKRAYYGAQLASSSIDILKDGRKRLLSAKRDIEKALDRDSDKFTSNDLRELLVQEAEIESGYLETEALQEVAWEGLRIAGRFPRGARFKLDTLKLRPVHVEPRSADAYAEVALETRPDVRLVEAAVRAQAGLTDLARAELFPDVALVGGFGFAKGTTADDSPDPFASDKYNYLNWGVVIGMEWKVDFAAGLAKLHQAEATLAKRRAQREALIYKIRLAVTQHYGAMVRYQRTLTVRRIATKAAKALLVSRSLNFGLGLAKTADLLSALVTYSKVRLKYFRTIYEYNLAVGRLSRSVGVELAVPAPSRRE